MPIKRNKSRSDNKAQTPKKRTTIARLYGRNAYVEGIRRDSDIDSKFIKWLESTKDSKERLACKVAWYKGWDFMHKRNK